MTRRHFRLLWSIPIAFALFFVGMVLLSRWVRLPSIEVIGNKSEVRFDAVRRDHLFYIASYLPIESNYDNIISDLQFAAKDASGTQLEVKAVKRFFYTREHEGKTIFCGSVFRLSKNVRIPVTGKIESNVDRFPEVFWAMSTGSFAPIVLLLVSAFLLSICIVYPLTQKTRKFQRINV